MLKYIDKENNYNRKYPDIIIPKIDFFLKRLYELKSLINKKLKNKHQYSMLMDDINEDNMNKNINEESYKDFNDKNNDIIKRNSSNINKKKKNTLITFNKEIISPEIDKTLIQNQIKNKYIISQISKKNKINFNNINLIKSTPNNPSKISNFLLLMSKFRNGINAKEILLEKAQLNSQKFLNSEKQELKKFMRNVCRIKDKENYIDFSSLFAKNPRPKKTILDKFKDNYEEDNVLDPQLNKLKNNKLNLYLISNKNSNNIKNTIDKINNKTISSLYKVFHDTNNNIMETETKFSIDNYDNTFNSFYTNTTNFDNLSNKPLLYTGMENIKYINLNNMDINGNYKNYLDSYNDLYYKYIYDKLKKETNSKKFLSYDGTIKRGSKTSKNSNTNILSQKVI